MQPVAAFKNPNQDSRLIQDSLRRLQRLSGKEYAPAYQAVIKSLQDGSFHSLPTHEMSFKEGIPECYLQDPWATVVYMIKSLNINGGNLPSALEKNPYFEPEANDLVEDWHDMLKEQQIYRTLSESTYLSPSRGNKEYGHPHFTSFELEASTTNLLLSVPEEFGEHVAALPSKSDVPSYRS